MQVLSNIAELQLEEPTLLRSWAHRLLQIGEIDLAVQTFEQVLRFAAGGAAVVSRPGPGLGKRAEDASRGRIWSAPTTPGPSTS